MSEQVQPECIDKSAMAEMYLLDIQVEDLTSQYPVRDMGINPFIGGDTRNGRKNGSG
jgi:hypothetical protein